MYKHSKGSRGSTTSDTSPSTSSITLLKSCKCHVQDAIIIAVAITILLICLAASLISYFVVLQADVMKAQTTLQQIQVDTVTKVQEQLKDSFTKLKPLSSVVQYSSSNLDYKRQFLPIMDSGYPQYVEAVIYSERVYASDVASYTSNKRNQGGYYSGFSMHSGEQPTSSATPLVSADEYYPVILSDVVDDLSRLINPSFNRSNEIAFLGWDLASSTNLPTVRYVNNTLSPAISDVLLTLGGKNANGVQLYDNSSVATMIPILDNTGRLKGIFSGFFGVEEIIESVFTDSLNDVVVTLIDTNKTSANGGLCYNSLSYANIADVNNVQKSAQFNTAQTFTLLNKQYQLVLTSTDVFVNAKSGASRWLGPILCVVIFFILEGFCLAMFFFLRLRLSLKERKKSKRAINALKDGNERTKLLLHRLAKQEAKARATVDAVPFFVIILNATGRILHTNKNFDKSFGYSETQLQNSLHITSVLPSFTANIFCEPKYSSDEADVYIRAIATTNEGQDIDVRCVVKNLLSTGLSRMGSGSLVGTPITPMTPMSQSEFPDEAAEDEEAFAIIGTAIAGEVQDAFDLRKKNVNTNEIKL